MFAPPLLLRMSEGKSEGNIDKDRVTCTAIVMMRDHFILAALTMVIFHY